MVVVVRFEDAQQVVEQLPALVRGGLRLDLESQKDALDQGARLEPFVASRPGVFDGLGEDGLRFRELPRSPESGSEVR